ncbi:nucleotidyltransferase [Paenibacillus sp. Y412MC10]|uniref:nucleotidyltransferase domain-containing protein n=1 Tax=Geobacillus sp. (strain Y412MC10) TaxID=481743 RepID=UPI0011AB3A9F|nr:nucleotidyltransferase [Paenibacillus sp. Y412MC10]
MNLFYTVNDQLDDLLQRVGYKLQISKTQRELAEDRYHAVANWLAGDESLSDGNDLQIYSQGSLRIGTTVKPLHRQEYDLDLVCEINKDWRVEDPVKLLNRIEKRLREHKTYAPMIERKNRCIRLNYANEFHMDILPAHPADNTSDTCLKVPDRKAEWWKDSNPKGYAEWIESRSHQYTEYVVKAGIEPLPDDESVERKSPLKRAVQLIKRHRDVYFEKSPDDAPISIVLTTLAGTVYSGQTSVSETISAVLKGILNLLPRDGSRIVVLNPTNPAEDLSERWIGQPELFKAFVKFVQDFSTEWSSLKNLQGIHNIAEALKALFGENVTTEAVKDQTAYVEKIRRTNQLAITNRTGMLTAAASAEPVITPVKRNTFYGT